MARMTPMTFRPTNTQLHPTKKRPSTFYFLHSTNLMDFFSPPVLQFNNLTATQINISIYIYCFMKVQASPTLKATQLDHRDETRILLSSLTQAHSVPPHTDTHLLWCCFATTLPDHGTNVRFSQEPPEHKDLKSNLYACDNQNIRHDQTYIGSTFSQRPLLVKKRMFDTRL